MNRVESDFLNTEPLKSSINKLKDVIAQHIDEYNGEKKWNLYIHIIPKELSGYDHDKYYVGVTNDIKRRWQSNGSGYRQLMFFSAINKYGWDNIVHIVLFDNLYEKLCYQLEKELINMLHSQDRERGYNVSEGGVGGNKTGTKKIRQYTSNGIFIKEWESAAEAARYYKKDRTSVTNAVRNNRRFLGYQWSYSDILEIGPYIRNRPYNVQRRSYANGNNPNAKQLYCITTGEKFASIKEAVKKYHTQYRSIKNNILGLTPYAGKDSNNRKLQWKYLLE